MVDLGAVLDRRLLDLDEIADFGLGADVGAGPEAGERPTIAPPATRALSRWENAWIDAPSSIVTFRSEHDMRLDHDVAANFCVKRQEHGFGGGQRRAREHGAPAQPVLHRRLGGSELRPGR